MLSSGQVSVPFFLRNTKRVKANNKEIESTLNNLLITEEVTLDGLLPFFDLLARFDYEDKQKDRLEVNIDSTVSAPVESILGSNQ